MTQITSYAPYSLVIPTASGAKYPQSGVSGDSSRPRHTVYRL
ncbi:Uncharacterised protein [Vibrio cholerae]|nr:Uncharacterised protein [Vibrio cholerae]